MPSLRTRISNIVRGLAMLGMGSPNSGNWWWPFGGEGTSSGEVVTVESAMRVSAVHACVRVLSETLAQLPIHVYERLPRGRKRWAQDHPLSYVLKSPNGWQTGFEYRELGMSLVNYRGNCVSLKVPGIRGAVTELWPLDPSRMAIAQLPDKSLRYTFTNPGTGATKDYRQDQIFHVRNFSMDSFAGLSTVAIGADYIGKAMAAEKYTGAFFKHGTKPQIVLETDAPVKKEDAQKTLEGWERTHGGAINAHKTALLPFGLKARELGLSNVDAQLIEQLRMTNEDIARIFRVPLHMIGELSRSTNNNIEQQSIEFVVYTMLPWLRRWEEAIERDLLTDDRYYVRFNFDGLLRGDSAARSAYYTTMLNCGVFSINDVRELEDMDPIDDGDVHLVQGAMVPLERLLNPPVMDTVPPAVPASDDEETDDTEDDTNDQELSIRRAQIDTLTERIGILEAKYDTARDAYGASSHEAGGLRSQVSALELARSELQRETERLAFDLKCSQEEATTDAERIAELEVEMSVRAETLAHLQAQNAESLKRATDVVLDTGRRMIRTERDRVLGCLHKRSKGLRTPAEFLHALEGMYADHATVLARQLAAPLDVYCLLSGEKLPRPIEAYLEHSQAMLLAAAEGEPTELETRVEACLSTWEARAEEFLQPKEVTHAE